MEQLDFMKQMVAEEEHRKFVDSMYPRFGLKNHPGYCEIKVRPLFNPGCLVETDDGQIKMFLKSFMHKKTLCHFSRRNDVNTNCLYVVKWIRLLVSILHIFLNDDIEEDAFKYTTWHESSHFLHPFWRQNRQKLKDTPQRNYRLNEIVAELGSLIFLDENYGLSSENIRKYLAGGRKSRKFNEGELTALVIAKRNKDLFGKIVNDDMNNVRRILTPYRKEARIYLNSLCGNVSLMNFSGLGETT